MEPVVGRGPGCKAAVKQTQFGTPSWIDHYHATAPLSKLGRQPFASRHQPGDPACPMNTESPEPALPLPEASRRAQLQDWYAYHARLLGLHGKGGVLLAGLLVLLWLSSGIFKVQPDEQGVVLRFGKFQDTVDAGLHYHWPYPVESVLLPKVTQVNQLQLGVARTGSGSAVSSEDSHERQMLTGDENIVEAECAVFWKIKDAKQFLFRVKNPEASVRITAESALREIIGRTPIQAAMSDKRQQIADETRELMQALLDKENAGILVSQVQLQRVDPPAAVIDAFNDVQRARTWFKPG
jgi:membrane protease subunit HflK